MRSPRFGAATSDPIPFPFREVSDQKSVLCANDSIFSDKMQRIIRQTDSSPARLTSALQMNQTDTERKGILYIMKATGIVRRIDDLGRVVIPKEIRRTMRIREGDPLEIYTDRDGEVIFKKYSPIGELNTFAAQYADTLHKTCELDVLICDRRRGHCGRAGVPRRDYAEKQLSEELEKIIEGRSLYVWREGDENIRRCRTAVLII